jgi:hypothetical protein
MKRRCPTDLSDAEWQFIEPQVESANKRGRPMICSSRRVLDAISYVLRTVSEVTYFRILEVSHEVCYHAPVAYGPSARSLRGRGALGRRGISSGGLRDVDGPVYLVGARLGLRHVPRGQALAVNP